MRPRRIAAFAVAAGVAAGPLCGCAQPQQAACQTGGCVSQVVVDIHQLAGVVQDRPFQATLCVSGTCQMQAGSLTGTSPMLTVVTQLAVNGAPTFSPEKVPVSLTVVLRDGTQVLDTKTTVDLREVRPNGTGCRPVCMSKSLSLMNGQLVDSGASTSPS